MTYTQEELARRFAYGADSGTASNMTIVPGRDGDADAHIVGYGWAIYATRDANGRVTLHDGWRGYSPSTTQQLGKISPYADRTDDADPRWDSRPAGGRVPARR